MCANQCINKLSEILARPSVRDDKNWKLCQVTKPRCFQISPRHIPRLCRRPHLREAHTERAECLLIISFLNLLPPVSGEGLAPPVLSTPQVYDDSLNFPYPIKLYSSLMWRGLKGVWEFYQRLIITFESFRPGPAPRTTPLPFLRRYSNTPRTKYMGTSASSLDLLVSVFMCYFNRLRKCLRTLKPCAEVISSW